MQKPNGYDETQASGEYTPINLGGHYCVIKQVSEKQSATGKEMIVVLLDFCGPDQQEGCFAKEFNGDTRPDKKWPYQGTKYIMVKDYQDPKMTSKQFKTFCTCVEKSNNFEIKWGGNNWSAQFKGKKIGAVYGEEESEYNGKTSMRHLIRWFCSTDAVKDARIPEPKYINSKAPAAKSVATVSANQDFINVPNDADDEIPF